MKSNKFSRLYDQFLNTMVEYTWVEQSVHTDMKLKDWLREYATIKFSGPVGTGHTDTAKKLARVHEGLILVSHGSYRKEIVKDSENFAKTINVMSLPEFRKVYRDDKKVKKLPSLIIIENASSWTDSAIQSVYDMVKDTKRLVILQLH